MGKIGIITCSTSGLDYLEGHEDIFIARTTILMDSQEYLDGKDLHHSEFYQRLDSLEEIPTTAQPSTGQLLDIYEEMKKQGYTDAIYVAISEHLSGTYQGVCLSKTYVEDFNVYPFNSRSASFISGFMAIEANRMAKEGASLDKIIDHLKSLRDQDRIFFMVDNLNYLVKNGRLSNGSAFIASMLKIKPLLELNEEGKIVAAEKIRTSKKALNRVVESFLQETHMGKDQRFTFIFNTQAPEKVALVKKKLQEAGIDTSEIIDAPISPAIGCHIGKGVVGLGYIK